MNDDELRHVSGLEFERIVMRLKISVLTELAEQSLGTDAEKKSFHATVSRRLKTKLNELGGEWQEMGQHALAACVKAALDSWPEV